MKKVLSLFRIVLINLLVFFILMETVINIVVAPFFPDCYPKRFLDTAARGTLSHDRVFEPINRAPFYRIKLPPEKKKNMIVIGDSIVFGPMVAVQNTFPAEIAALTGQTVVNLGVIGACPRQYNKVLTAGLRYDPDIILYCLFPNDFAESVWTRNWEASYLSAKTGVKTVDWDTQLFTDAKKFAGAGYFKSYFLIKKFVIFVYLYKIGFVEKHVRPVRIEGKVEYTVPGFWNECLNLNLSTVQRGFNLAVADIKNAFQTAREKGKTFVVVLVPCKEMIYGRMTEAFDMNTAYQTYSVTERLLQQNGIPCFDATDWLTGKERDDPDHTLYLTADTHFNQAGNRALAEGIVRYLRLHSFI